MESLFYTAFDYVFLKKKVTSGSVMPICTLYLALMLFAYIQYS